MAAVNHIRNRRSQRMRDVFEDFVARCLDGGHEVNVDHLLQMFDSTNSNFDAKEVAKIREIAGGDEHISKFVLCTSFLLHNINFSGQNLLNFVRQVTRLKVSLNWRAKDQEADQEAAR